MRTLFCHAPGHAARAQRVEPTLPINISQKPLPAELLRPVIAPLIIALIGGWVYHPLFNLALWGDDAFLMKLAARHNTFELLFKGPARSISQNNFMPLLGITFRIDHLLFGLNFTGRNLHSLFWLIAVGYLGHLLLRRLGLKPWTALAGGVALMVSPAVVSVAGHFSNRHYLFGLAYALLSLIMIIQWRTQARPWMFRAAVGFYFLALCSKEIYAPLLVVAGFMVWQSGADVAKTLRAYTAAFGLYLILRWIMLGSVVGGYTRHIEWGRMFAYLAKSLPRLTETILWGGALPGRIDRPAVFLGCLVVAATALLAMKVSGWRGLAYFCGLLGLSLCVITLTLYVPPIRYAEDPFYCHGDRLALAFSTAVWLSLSYVVGRLQNAKRIPDKIVLPLCVMVILPLALYGGLLKANRWKMAKATVSQVRFLNRHASQNWLVIGHPTWFLSHYLMLLSTSSTRVRMQSIDAPGRGIAWRPEDYPAAVRLQPNLPIQRTGDPLEIQRWSEDFRVEYCRLFPDRCARPLGAARPARPAAAP